jgi:hypothetical protein
MRRLLHFSGILFFLIFLGHSAQATHLRAGQITAVRDAADPLTYIFTLTLYRDSAPPNADQPDATIFIYTSDRKTKLAELKENVNSPRRVVGLDIEELTYTFRYKFPGAGQYVVYFLEEFRNAEIVNMFNSVNTPFYVETVLTINQSLGLNSTPVLLNPPIDGAEVGQRFCHNPAAFDPDGDSLAYRMVIPRQNVNLEVNGYRSPETVGPPPGTPESGSGAPTFTLNPLTGEICWDSPGPFGVGSKGFAEYNIAFVVEEYRKTSAGYIKIGEVVRDMQITVREQPNKRPELIIPRDTCIVAGTVLRATIRATDPDKGQQIRISSESAIFSTLPALFPAQPPATLSPDNHPPKVRDQYVYQGNPAQSQFSWSTDCQHVRAQPYDVVFKAEDNASSANDKIDLRLSDTKTWRVRVVGPAPTGLRATVQSDGIRLDWTAYRCANASEIAVWRRVGCSPDAPDPCPDGGPAGYTLVGRVRAGVTTFTDRTVQSGVQYSYRLTAGFAPPAGGLSLASQPVCARLKLTVPLITKVSVERTSTTNGQIRVRWAQPLELNTADIPGPYQYHVYRATGFSRSFSPTPVYTSETIATIPSSPTSYLEFVDSGLNTEANPYTYVVVFSSRGGAKTDSSRTASSVRLSAESLPNAVKLTWQARVPWDNSNTTHVVYREDQSQKNRNPKVYTKLAEVAVRGSDSFTFTDTGNGISLNKDSVYCYRVETYGTYNEPLVESPLRNYSQELCVSPLDTIKPCAVTLSINETPCVQWIGEEGSDAPSFCSVSSFENKLSWVYPQTEGSKTCDKDVIKYRIYYKRYEEDQNFTVIDSVTSPAPPATEYTHNGLTSFAGCYYVTAVDRSGNESAPSNVVCQDNCPYYVLPNIITPGLRDNSNDLFRPFPCPRFVESVRFSVYNRWGRKVYETDKSIYLNWNGSIGKDENTGQENVSSSVYYYIAEVKFRRLRRQDEIVKIKGWLQVMQ